MSAPARRVFGVLLGIGLAAGFASPAAARGPVDLHGSPLRGTTGLRLLVADSRPFVLAVDSGAVTRVRGLRAAPVPGFSVLAVSARAAIVTALDAPSANKPQYLVRSGQATATLLGTARDVVPAANSEGVWATRVASPGHCRLQRVGSDGRGTVSRAIPCRWITAPAGSLGLVVGRTRVIDPVTGRKLLAERRGIIGVAGDHVLVAGGPGYAPGYRFTLLDASTGHAVNRVAERRRLGGRSGNRSAGALHRTRVRRPVVGSDGLAGARCLGARHHDGEAGASARHAGVRSLKATSMQWTHDGDSCCSRRTTTRAFVAVWRPGQRTLPIKPVALPKRTGGSDSFAPFQ